MTSNTALPHLIRLPSPPDPFGQNLTKVRALRSVGSRYPRIRTGLSCVAYNVSANDTWTTVAAKYRVGVLELMRSNPSIAGATLPVGQFVFIPPCVNGGEAGASQD